MAKHVAGDATPRSRAAILIQIKPFGQPVGSRTGPGKCAVAPIATELYISDTAKYGTRAYRRDGSAVDIRALRLEDEADMLTALDQTSPQSLQSRFSTMR